MARDFVKPEYIFTGQGISTRDAMLEFIAKRGVELGLAGDYDELLRAYHAREEEGPTGMIDGFAIPHAKADTVTHAAAFVVKTTAPIEDWETMDGGPVRCAIALLVPGLEAGTTHLRLLAQTATALMDERFRELVLDSEDPAAIAAAVNERLEEE